jgi:hypothetical protein
MNRQELAKSAEWWGGVKLRLTLELVPTDVAVRAPADMDMDDGRPPWVRQDRGWLGLNGAEAFIVVVVVVSRKNQEEEHRVGDNLTCLGFIYSTHVRIDARRDKGPVRSIAICCRNIPSSSSYCRPVQTVWTYYW